MVVRGVLVLLPLAIVPLAIACGNTNSVNASESYTPDTGDEQSNDEGGPIVETPVYRNPDGSPNTQIRCGSSVCDSTIQDCCVGNDDTMARLPTFTCAPKGTCGDNYGFFMSCSSTANCPIGDVCCGTWPADPATTVHVDCRASCDGPADEQFCAVDSECAPGQTCTQALFDSCSGDAEAPLPTLQ